MGSPGGLPGRFLPTLLVCAVTLPASTTVRGDMAACDSKMARYKIGAVELCVPADETGYAVRSVDETSVAFKEQFFSGSTRVSDVDSKMLKRADGIPVVAVLTTVLDGPSSDATHAIVEQQLDKMTASLLQHDSVVLTIDLPAEGPTKFAFNRSEDGKFLGESDRGSRYKSWLSHYVRNRSTIS